MLCSTVTSGGRDVSGRDVSGRKFALCLQCHMDHMHCPWEEVDHVVNHCSIDKEQARSLSRPLTIMHIQTMHCAEFVHGTSFLCTWTVNAGTVLSNTRCLQSSTRLKMQTSHR